MHNPKMWRVALDVPVPAFAVCVSTCEGMQVLEGLPIRDPGHGVAVLLVGG